MEILTHWAVTHSAVLLIGLFLGWNSFLRPTWVRQYTLDSLKWFGENVSFKDLLWFAGLMAAVSSSKVFKGATGVIGKIRDGLQWVATSILTLASDVTSYSNKTINKDGDKVNKETDKST